MYHSLMLIHYRIMLKSQFPFFRLTVPVTSSIEKVINMDKFECMDLSLNWNVEIQELNWHSGDIAGGDQWRWELDGSLAGNLSLLYFWSHLKGALAKKSEHQIVFCFGINLPILPLPDPIICIRCAPQTSVRRLGPWKELPMFSFFYLLWLSILLLAFYLSHRSFDFSL